MAGPVSVDFTRWLFCSYRVLFSATLPQPFPWLIVIAAILGGIAGTFFLLLVFILSHFPPQIVIVAIVFLVIFMKRQRSRDQKAAFYTRLADNERAAPDLGRTAVPLAAISPSRKEVRLVVEQATANPEDWVSSGEWVWVQSRTGQQGYYPKEWLRVQ